MNWLIVVVVIVIYIISKISDGSQNKEKDKKIEEERSKYKDRVLNLELSLYERNSDIIEEFKNKISTAHFYDRYYLDNLVRDTLNEICLAENQIKFRPNYAYLSSWELNAPKDWVELSRKIKDDFRNRLDELKKDEEELNTEISQKKAEINSIKNKNEGYKELVNIRQRNGKGEFTVDEISSILKPSEQTWSDTEKKIIGYSKSIKKIACISIATNNASVKKLNSDIESFNKTLELDAKERIQNKEYVSSIFSGYKNNQKTDVIQRFNYVLSNIQLPYSIPKIWKIEYDDEQKIVVLEIKLPDVVHNEVFKKIELKNGIVNKPLNQKEIKEKVPNIHPAIILRMAYEIFREDIFGLIKLLVVNGWVEYDDPSTGVLTKTYTASLAIEKEQIININLQKIDPLTAFVNLKGKSAGKLIDIIPITPIMSLNKNDKRFIDTKEVLNDLGSETNLASMDWQDFESLIAELFSKEFEKEGGEVKVTQASRDRGVDAVVFDPDPIKGGKFVIQAKRYTHTVDVSAVRDLCAVVKKEGASRGILVTTSTYGADAYAFANNEPVTLLNGAELLGLLKKHGYTFRINLAEARKLYEANSK